MHPTQPRQRPRRTAPSTRARKNLFPPPRNKANSEDDVFKTFFEKLILIEGGYSAHAADSGGRTRYGITEACARSYGYTGAMARLPLAVAAEIYRKHFWLERQLDAVALISVGIAEKLFDAGVNVGPARPARWLQLALNALSYQEQRWKYLATDARLGTKTLQILTAAVTRYQLEKTLLKALNAQQGSYYINLALARPKDQTFLRGWLNKRIHFP